MPRYDYKCSDCGRVYEIDIPLNREWRGNLACDDCLGLLERQVSAPAFILKGEGWTPKAGPRGGK